MESSNKRTLMVLSIVEIVMSAIFFILGMVDGFKIRFGYVSLLYTQCWLAALALPIGAMGLVLTISRRPSLILINAIWSVSVACILYSAMTVYLYHHWGMEWLLFANYDTSSGFVKKDALLELTKEDEHALAVFGITIILSIMEIIIAAAVAKTSDACYNLPQPTPMYNMRYQRMQDDSQHGRANAGAPEIHATITAENQPVSFGNFAVSR